MHISPRLSGAVLTPIAAIALAACGSSKSPSTDSTSPSSMPGMNMSQHANMSSSASGALIHNAADVAFASSMLPHHAQAVTMADLALGKATSAQVRQMAQQMKAMQSKEIQTMTEWMSAWHEPMPAMSMSGEMGLMAMNGMMTDAEMQGLSSASGATFDKMWLQLMIKHHQGAIAMAEDEKSKGENSNSQALAASVISAQTTEIKQMQAVLNAMG